MDRLHYKLPKTSPSWIVNRVAKFHPSTAFSYVEDLENIFKIHSHGKSGVFLSVNGGPDWNPRSNIVFLSMGRLWERLDLDYLFITINLPRFSAYNPIEHYWSPRAKDISGFVFLATLPSESKAPTEASEIAEVYNTAAKQLSQLWDGKTFDGWNVCATSILGDATERIEHTQRPQIGC